MPTNSSSSLNVPDTRATGASVANVTDGAVRAVTDGARVVRVVVFEATFAAVFVAPIVAVVVIVAAVVAGVVVAVAVRRGATLTALDRVYASTAISPATLQTNARMDLR